MPFKGCLSDACVLMKIERFVLKPLRKIERFVLKQHTFRFADYTIVFAMIGNKILKSEVFMDMLAMTYIIVSVIGVVFFDMALH